MTMTVLEFLRTRAIKGVPIMFFDDYHQTERLTMERLKQYPKLLLREIYSISTDDWYCHDSGVRHVETFYLYLKWDPKLE